MNTKLDFVVVGTGPSGVAAAAALIDKGIKPTFIDAGVLTNGLVMTAANRQTSVAKEDSKTPTNPGQKAWFGSYEAYAQNYPSKTSLSENLHVRSSNSIGGFSRVWGATFEFWSNDGRWPQESFPQVKDFDAIRNLVFHSTTQLSEESADTHRLSGAQSSTTVFRRLKKRLSKLEPSLVQSTLAIQTQGAGACTLCARCLDGCPQDAIWFSGDQVQKWLIEGKATLISGFKASRIYERKDFIEIECISKLGEISVFTANRVYLAAGPIGTAEIAINSGLVSEVEISDTSTIFTAAIGLVAQKQDDLSHSLSQFWLKWKQELPLAAQIYAPNRSNLERLVSRFPFLGPFRFFLAPVVMRMHPVIAYLDPEMSPTLKLKGMEGRIEVSEVGNPRYVEGRTKALSEIRKALIKGGLIVPPIGTDFSPAGTGFHHGSSFPLGKTSDNLGKLVGWNSVHVVDSSVLPYLSVGSITPTVMANAHRIARESVQ